MGISETGVTTGREMAELTIEKDRFYKVLLNGQPDRDNPLDVEPIELPGIALVDPTTLKPIPEAMETSRRFGYIDPRADAYILGEKVFVIKDRLRKDQYRAIQFYQINKRD